MHGTHNWGAKAQTNQICITQRITQRRMAPLVGNQRQLAQLVITQMSTGLYGQPLLEDRLVAIHSAGTV